MRLSQFSAVTWTQLQNALLIRSSYSEYLDNLSTRDCCSDWNFWVDGKGRWLHQNTEKQQQFGYSDVTEAITLGTDICYNDFVVGMTASYTHSNLDWEQSAGDSQINSYYCGLYGSWDNGCFYVNASVLGAFSDYHTSRHLQNGTIYRHANSSHDSWEALTGIEVGVPLEEVFCSIDFIPYACVDYVYLSQQGFSENGAGVLNLNVRSRNDQLLQSEIGVQFTRRMLCDFNCDSWIFAPNLSLSYINQTSLTGHSYDTTLVNRNITFNVDGWNFEHNLGAVSLSFNFLDNTETLKFALYYDGQFGKNYWNQAGGIMCNLCF